MYKMDFVLPLNFRQVFGAPFVSKLKEEELTRAVVCFSFYSTPLYLNVSYTMHGGCWLLEKRKFKLRK